MDDAMPRRNMRDILRLFALASRLSSGEGATVNEILKSGIGYTSRSSIYADFQMLSERFMIPVYDSDERRGISGREVVKYIDKDIWNSFRSQFMQTILNEDDKLLLSFVIESIGSLSPLISAADDGFLSRVMTLAGDMIIEPTGTKGYFAMTDVRNLLMLLRAQKEKRAVNIYYKDEKEARILYPLKCFSFSGGIYCYVMRTDGLIYTVSVPRVRRVTRTFQKEGKALPFPQADIDKALSDPFGIVNDGKEFTAVVWLSERQGQYETEKAWPDSVKIENTEGGYLFTVTTCGSYWIKRWILSLGTEAELLEPVSLREELAEDLGKILGRYKEAGDGS